jgi:beta-glucosidase
LQDWLTLADAYWLASTESETGIPLLWGTDAVHGHNNVRGATLFPHNLGLGATQDPELVRAIAEATRGQVIASGLDWTFAPTVALATDPAWGRTYESYGQDPAQIYHFAKAAVEGYQSPDLTRGILATAKHFIGDGATNNGKDQGDSFLWESQFVNRHAQGYYGAMDANVQVIMASFNSWWTKKLHGHPYLLTDVLKIKMGFDGFVVSDWNGITQVYQCTVSSCPDAINAGIDMVMVPSAWREFIRDTMNDVEQGLIPMARIDDAVRGILRVKFRAGLFEKPRPSERPGAGDETLLNSAELNALARRAVQASTVVLKNDEQLLPLNPNGNYLVLGRSDHIATHAGGWSLNWQGGAFDNSFFGPASTLLEGVDEALTRSQPVATRLPVVGENTQYDAAIVVLTERSYAEGAGDLTTWQSHRADRQTGFHGLKEFKTVRERFPSLPIVTVYIGGRPLWLSPQINQSDAFVVGWLPGTQSAGIADVLFGKAPATGKLPLHWPKDDCAGKPSEPRHAAFQIGDGLSFEDNVRLAKLPETPAWEIGTNGLAPDCFFQRHLLTPFR